MYIILIYDMYICICIYIYLFNYIYNYIYIDIYVWLSKLLVWRKDINITSKGPIANHSFVAICTSLRYSSLRGVSLILSLAKVIIDHIHQDGGSPMLSTSLS